MALLGFRSPLGPFYGLEELPKKKTALRGKLYFTRAIPEAKWVALSSTWFAVCVYGGTPPPPCNSYTLVIATVGVGTVLIWYLILIRYKCSAAA